MTEEESKFVADMESTALGEARHFYIDEVDRLCKIIRSYEKMLAEGVVIYGKPGRWKAWSEVQRQFDTHKARLVQIEEIEK